MNIGFNITDNFNDLDNFNGLDNFNDLENSKHNEIFYQLDEIKTLSNKINNLFELYFVNNILNPIQFNYNFQKEFNNGFIEYKRTLLSYITNDKIDKLIRQIYWRIHEGLIVDNTCLCYYIIGVEDSGKPSFITDNELVESVNFILLNVKESEINFSYLYLINTNLNYKFVIIKFWCNNEKFNIFN